VLGLSEFGAAVGHLILLYHAHLRLIAFRVSSSVDGLVKGGGRASQESFHLCLYTIQVHTKYNTASNLRTSEL